MSLNTILLPPQVVADLYQHSLVQGAVSATPLYQPILALGDNKKNILILINNKSEAFLPDATLQFLTAVLSACQLDLSHVAIVNLAQANTAPFSALQAQFAPRHLLLLDVMPDVMGLPAALPYTVQTFNGLQFVAAPSLWQIEKTKQAKSQLWVALKQLFCL